MVLRGPGIAERSLRGSFAPARLRGGPAGPRGRVGCLRGSRPAAPAGYLPPDIPDDAKRRGCQGPGPRDLRAGVSGPGDVPGAVPLLHLAVPDRHEPVPESLEVVRPGGSGRA